jgi:hypothetical protein
MGIETIALVSLAAAAAAASAAAAKQNAAAQQAQADQQRQAAEYNATVDRNNALAAADAATRNEEAARNKFAVVQGAARAEAAESGAGLDGSNADILKQNAVKGELDALNVRYAGANQTAGLLSEANMQDYQGRAAAINRGMAGTAGNIGMASALLNGGVNVGLMGMRTGAWGPQPAGTVKPSTN